MDGISGVNQVPYGDYGKLASGKRITSAADDAAGLAIATKEETVASGLTTGSDNMQAGRDLLNISDGALGNITDNLQRMRELALQASNTATLTDSDRAKLNDEFDQLKQGIADIAGQTTYNTKNILDGTQMEYMLATDDQGHGKSISTGNATLDALGIQDLSLDDPDIDAIDSALEKVSSMRSSAGAQTNTIEHAVAYNDYAAYNTTSAASRIEDLDMEKAVSEMKKKMTLETYSLMMQKKRQEDEATQKRAIFGAAV